MSFSATLQNKHLFVDVDDETGRIFLSTLEGHDDVRGDEKTNLLFYDKPPASYTLIYVDNDIYVFGSEQGEFSKNPVSIDDSVEVVWQNELVWVRQEVRFVRRKESDVEDGVLITYSVENASDRKREIGIRQLFDTWLGEGSSGHFVLHNGKTLDFETRLEGVDVPLSWKSERLLENIPVVLRGVLRGELVSTPEKVVFANYRSLHQHPLDYRVSRKKGFDNLPYSRNDSAVALYYGPVTLWPGDTYEFATILGLSGEGDYGVRDEEHMIRAAKARSFTIGGEALAKALERIIFLKGSLDRINEVINTLNTALESEEKILSEDKMKEIRGVLDEIKKQGNGG
jgi:hypothetical protein